MALLDFALMAALPEEFQALRKIFPEFREKNVELYCRARLDANPPAKSVRYALVTKQQRDMGPLYAHQLAGEIVLKWDPAYIVLVGIAGSMRDEVKLGDVVVSQQVYYYDPGKATDR